MANLKITAARRNNLAKIHIARKQLCLEDEDYRLIVKRVCGVESAADADFAGHLQLLKEFKRLGWKPKPAKTAQAHSIKDPQSRRIRWLWLRLIEVGQVRSTELSALASYVKRLTGVDRLEWLTAAQAHRVIGSLQQWASRVGALDEPLRKS
ncbi:MAG: regulatory protein GemA [Candidatus Competibacter sp.]|nr:regulatory protein GemA [Candidatus Competibacter sp.]MDG4583376.1 regulatory protein GemA [Candidatus Competibacter sp.]